MKETAKESRKRERLEKKMQKHQFGEDLAKVCSKVMEPSIYEKSLKKWSMATREELLAHYKKLQLIFVEKGLIQMSDVHGVEYLSDAQLRELIANTESKLSINSRMDWLKATKQDQTKYKGRQKGRAYHSFH